MRGRVDWEKASRLFLVLLSVCRASESKNFHANERDSILDLLRVLSRESGMQVYAELS